MIKGKNLILRAPEPGDIETMYRWENDPEVWHLSNTSVPVSRFTLEQYILSAHQDIFTSKQLRLMIELRKPVKPVGSIDLFDFDPMNRRAGLGILIAREERRKGYASEAVGLMIKYCFETLHLHQLYCNISADNEVSLALFTNHGFVTIGLKKDWLYKGEKWMDEYILQLVNG